MESEKAAAGLDKVTDHVEDSSVGVDAEEELKAVRASHRPRRCDWFNFRLHAGNGGVHCVGKAEKESSYHAVCHKVLLLVAWPPRNVSAATCHWLA